ncbi:MAG: hypothetical protein U5L00_03755 [Desulfovermiculus sp.]|nr:hypothetical protein [Desulfovermiculus sp.]
MKLIITIDTEEDSWNRYSPTNNSVQNIDRVVHLQELFDEFGVRPTYLVTYPVASNPEAVEILKRILEQGRCEIGTHCHPWNTPPLGHEDPVSKPDTMLCNLDKDLVQDKLFHLHQTIQQNLGLTPVSFRAGRFGFGPAVAQALSKLKYRVDSSVTPFVSWTDHYGPDFTEFYPEAFRFSAQGLAHRDEKGELLEVPVTIGFLQQNFAASRQRLQLLEGSLPRRIHLAGILERMRLLNLAWLSPENSEARDMIRLAQVMQKKNHPFLNLTFHSTSLKTGSGTFVNSNTDEKAFFKKLRIFLEHAQRAGWRSLTLAELEDSLQSNLSTSASMQTNMNQHAENTTALNDFPDINGRMQWFRDMLPKGIKLKLKRNSQNLWSTSQYSALKRKHALPAVRHILFVCKGNICRSPFAEHALRALFPGNNLRIESCGLHVDQQVPSPPEAVQAAKKFGIDLSQNTSRSIFSCDLNGADLIVAMEYNQLQRLGILYPEHMRKAVLLREFAPFPHNMVCNIYDPYGLGQDEFYRCFGLMEKALKGLMARIRVDSE